MFFKRQLFTSTQQNYRMWASVMFHLPKKIKNKTKEIQVRINQLSARSMIPSIYCIYHTNYLFFGVYICCCFGHRYKLDARL